MMFISGYLLLGVRITSRLKQSKTAKVVKRLSVLIHNIQNCSIRFTVFFVETEMYGHNDKRSNPCSYVHRSTGFIVAAIH